MAEGSILLKFGVDISGLKTGLKDAEKSMVSWRDQTNKGSTDMLKWGAAIGVSLAPLVAMGYELVNLTTKAAAFGKAIKDNARDLGLSTEQYQRWSHAAIATGSTADEMTASIRMLTVRLKEASDPESEAARYLAAMGISAYTANGELRDTNAVLMDIIPALNALPEGMERNQASMVLFGRGFSNIADLTSLSRTELEKIMDQAPVFSDDKIQKMDDMATEMSLLNEQIQIMSVDLGEDLIPLAQDMIGIFTELKPLIEGVAGTLHEAATGTTMMVQGLQLLYTQWKYGMDSPEMKSLQASVQKYAESEYNERNGISDKPVKSILDLQMEAQMRRERALKVAPAKTTTSVGSTSEPKTPKEISPLWDASSVVGAAGSNMQLFMQREMELGIDYQTALNNWSMGAPTNNTPIADSLGQIPKIGTTVTAIAGLSAQDQTAVKSAETLTAKIESAYNTQLENFTKFSADMMTLTAQHWTTITGFQADALRAMSESDAKFTKFVAENPTIKNIGVVTWTKEGADWDPTKNAEFMQTARINSVISNIPTFVKPEFKIAVNVKIDKKGQASATAEGMTTGVMRAGIGQ